MNTINLASWAAALVLALAVYVWGLGCAAATFFYPRLKGVPVIRIDEALVPASRRGRITHAGLILAAYSLFLIADVVWGVFQVAQNGIGLVEVLIGAQVAFAVGWSVWFWRWASRRGRDDT